MTEQEFAFVAKLLFDRSAIVLEAGKEYLVESRLAPLAKRHGLATTSQFIQRLRESGSNGLHAELVEAMVTTETSFFRDIHPFETLRRTVFPELIKARGIERRLNIWCAACSSGQEPYTIALILREYFPELATWTIKFLATDISREMLQRCQAGRFSQLEVNRGLPTALLLKYFRQEGAQWILADEIRSSVEFQQMNLTQTWPSLPRMDLVFIRNVMIYFDVETKKAILRRLAQVLRPDGYLVLGGAETTFSLDESYQRVETLKGGYYRLVSK
jgi:chemotaxis protein methyltransferase CheR